MVAAVGGMRGAGHRLIGKTDFTSGRKTGAKSCSASLLFGLRM